MATDTSTILAGNPFKVLASTASASAVVQLIPEEDVPITDDVINEQVADDIAPPEQALSEQAKDVDTNKMESQKMSALEHSLTRNKEKNEEVKPVSASAILLHHSACIISYV